ncbi:MAG: AAA family ATPase [Bacteroides sp.]|nr:AAA family ATPase [Bacteroides sp.]
MVENIKIQNFKSVVDLDIPLGQFNILIGENGCGKSNILEAITFASAASVDQLDVEDLEKRGMRVPSPQFMYSAFEDYKQDNILVSFDLSNGSKESFCMHFSNEIESGRWIERGKINAKKLFDSLKEIRARSIKDVEGILSSATFKDDELIHVTLKNYDGKISIGPASFDKSITGFKIFSPNEKSLRRFDNPDNSVLGVDGIGLFSYLKKLSFTEKGSSTLNKIIDCMDILDWFNDFKIPSESLSGDNSIMLYDQYIDETLNYFDQRSANEAFLYLLFYFTLFISETTPSFFAIDNIESALNPKLCREFTKKLIKLAEIHNKQVIVTTHNPFVLDALDLTQENQRLFVVRRDVDGHTKINRIKNPEGSNLSLSEAWMKGYIGGLPNNF